MQLLMIGVDTETTSEQCYSHADCANDAFCGVVPCFGLKCARCLRCSACTCNKASVDGVCPAQRCALYAQVPVLSARRLSGVYSGRREKPPSSATCLQQWTFTESENAGILFEHIQADVSGLDDAQCPYERRVGKIDIIRTTTPGTSTRMSVYLLVPKQFLHAVLVDVCPAGFVFAVKSAPVDYQPSPGGGSVWPATWAGDEAGADQVYALQHQDYHTDAFSEAAASQAPSRLLSKAPRPALEPQVMLGVIRSPTFNVECSVTAVFGDGFALASQHTRRVSSVTVYKRACNTLSSRRARGGDLRGRLPADDTRRRKLLHSTQVAPGGECPGQAQAVSGVCAGERRLARRLAPLAWSALPGGPGAGFVPPPVTVSAALYHSEDEVMSDVDDADASCSLHGCFCSLSALYPGVDNCCEGKGWSAGSGSCARYVWLFSSLAGVHGEASAGAGKGAAVVATVVTFDRRSLRLSHRPQAAAGEDVSTLNAGGMNAVGSQKDNDDVLIVRAIASFSPAQWALCEEVLLCKQQLDVAQASSPWAQQSIQDPRGTSKLVPGRSVSLVLGQVSLGNCSAGITWMHHPGAPKCQLCTQVDGCHWCVREQRCVRDYTECVGDPTRDIVSHGTNPFGFVVACPAPDGEAMMGSGAGGAEADGANSSLTTLISYVGSIALSSFIQVIANNRSDAGIEAKVTALTANHTCIAGLYSTTGIRPCAACPGNTYSDLPHLNTKCMQCPVNPLTGQGKRSAPGSASVTECRDGCPPGFYARDGFPQRDDPCKPCPRNTYTSEPGTMTCTPCPSEHYTLFEGAESAADCLKIQLGIDRVMVSGRRLLLGVWWLVYPLADAGDAVSVCKVSDPPPGISYSRGEAADACKVLAWTFTSRLDQYDSHTGPNGRYLPGNQAVARGSADLAFESGGPGRYEVCSGFRTIS